ncbi:MAG: hypothetical protein ACI94Y_000321 [Maribacter sp.]|jgi:hypothetical protein
MYRVCLNEGKLTICDSIVNFKRNHWQCMNNGFILMLMKMKTQIIINLFLVVPVLGFAQLDIQLQISGKSFGELKTPKIINPHVSFLDPLSYNFFTNSIKENDENTSLVCTPYKGKAHTAFFCRMEDKLEHKVKLPVRVRLGTLDYVDQLEQKRTYRYRDWVSDNLIE